MTIEQILAAEKDAQKMLGKARENYAKLSRRLRDELAVKIRLACKDRPLSAVARQLGMTYQPFNRMLQPNSPFSVEKAADILKRIESLK